MSVQLPVTQFQGAIVGPAGCTRPASRCLLPHLNRLLIVLGLCILLCSSAVSAAELVLNTSSMEQYKAGISYSGTDPLVIIIADDVAISSTSYVGIESTAPVTIRSPTGKTLTITVRNDSVLLYGITAPTVTLESGHLAITVNGNNDGEKGNAFGISARAGNVTIAGGSITTTVETTGHKNKGIYASRYIVVSEGQVTTDERGGSNTFGLDGGDVENGDACGGILLSGGVVSVNSSGGKNRNVGIDSKFGTVRISGSPVIFIYEDGSAARQNFVYNTNITTISGGHAAVFTSDGGNYTLRENAILAQNITLIAGKTFEIPAGRSLGIADGTYLTKPSGTTLLFGGDSGTLTNSRSFAGAGGAVIYAGNEPTQKAALPVAVLLAGLGAAVLMRRKE
jgi:hypothetical protein